jgi:hypothetical protein
MFKKGEPGGMFKKHSVDNSNRMYAPSSQLFMMNLHPQSISKAEEEKEKAKINALEKAHK